MDYKKELEELEDQGKEGRDPQERRTRRSPFHASSKFGDICKCYNEEHVHKVQLEKNSPNYVCKLLEVKRKFSMT